MDSKAEGDVVWVKQSSCEQGFRHPSSFQLQEFQLYLSHKMGFHVPCFELRVPLIKTFRSYGSVQLSRRLTDWLKVILRAGCRDPVKLLSQPSLWGLSLLAPLRVKEDNPQVYGLGLGLIPKMIWGYKIPSIPHALIHERPDLGTARLLIDCILLLSVESHRLF